MTTMAMLLPALASAVAAAVPGPTFGNALAGLEICQGKPGQPDTTILNVRPPSCLLPEPGVRQRCANN